MKKWIIISSLAFLLLLSLFSIRPLTRKFFIGAYFQHFLENTTGEKLNARARYLPLYWNKETLCSDGLSINGNPASILDRFNAKNITAAMPAGQLFRQTFEIPQIILQEATLSLKKPLTENFSFHKKLAQKIPLLAKQVQINELAIRSGNLRLNPLTGFSFRIRDTHITIHPANRTWLIHAKAGKTQISNLPELRLDSFAGRYSNDHFHIDKMHLRNAENMSVQISGVFKKNRSFHTDIHYKSVPIEKLNFIRIPQLSGPVSGTISMQKEGALTYRGNLILDNGLPLNLNPWRKQLKAIDKKIPEIFSFSIATADFSQNGTTLQISNIHVENPNRIKITGTCNVVQNQLDGNIHLGLNQELINLLPPGALSIFHPEQDNYFWTFVHISGDPQHPKEDLTTRLVSAVLNEAPATLLKSAPKLIENTLEKTLIHIQDTIQRHGNFP